MAPSLPVAAPCRFGSASRSRGCGRGRRRSRVSRRVSEQLVDLAFCPSLLEVIVADAALDGLEILDADLPGLDAFEQLQAALETADAEIPPPARLEVLRSAIAAFHAVTSSGWSHVRIFSEEPQHEL